MLSYLMRQALLEALSAGPPYRVSSLHNLPYITQTHLLVELERRGLITSGPFPVLTEAGIAEANWFRSHEKGS